MTFIGTALVVGILPLDFQNVERTSLLFGLGSGIGYASYSIFSKFALEKYSSLTITTYTFTMAFLVLLALFASSDKFHLLVDPIALIVAYGIAFLPAGLAYIIYSHVLLHIEASPASILGTVEPIVATLIGVFIFHETFTFTQMIGMACIIGAVVLTQVYSQARVSDGCNYS